MTVTAPNRDLLLQIAQQLPASPQVLLRLNELLTDVNSGLDDVARLLRRDTGLATRIIRISNSIAFGMCGRVATIEDAVNRVGYAEIYRLTGLAAAAQLADQNLSYYGISGIQLRDNTLVVALAAEALANRAGSDSRVAYTAGLIRSTGKLVLDRFAKRGGAGGPPLFQAGALNILKWEQSTFGITNLETADHVLSTWRFPSGVIRPVRNHFSDTLTKTEEGITTTILHVACYIAQEAGVGLLGEQGCWNVSNITLQAIGLTPAGLKEATEEAKNAYEGIKGSL